MQEEGCQKWGISGVEYRRSTPLKIWCSFLYFEFAKCLAHCLWRSVACLAWAGRQVVLWVYRLSWSFRLGRGNWIRNFFAPSAGSLFVGWSCGGLWNSSPVHVLCGLVDGIRGLSSSSAGCMFVGCMTFLSCIFKLWEICSSFIAGCLCVIGCALPFLAATSCCWFRLRNLRKPSHCTRLVSTKIRHFLADARQATQECPHL